MHGRGKAFQRCTLAEVLDVGRRDVSITSIEAYKSINTEGEEMKTWSHDGGRISNHDNEQPNKY